MQFEFSGKYAALGWRIVTEGFLVQDHQKGGLEYLVDVRKTFGTADAVGNCTVFNIKGNSYRLITWISYQTKKVFIKHVFTHADYSKEDWKNDCFSR